MKLTPEAELLQLQVWARHLEKTARYHRMYSSGPKKLKELLSSPNYRDDFTSNKGNTYEHESNENQTGITALAAPKS